MNPGLISSRRLRKVAWVPDRGKAPVALLALLTAVAAAGAIQARTRDPVAPTPQLRAVASITYIAGTKVPEPDVSVGLVEDTAKVPGRHVFRAGAAAPTARQAGALFDTYLSSMVASGWTLAGKSVPSARGEWILKWDFGTQSALLSFYMAPEPRLIVDDCPPEPYC